jgi:hypothetical protein
MQQYKKDLMNHLSESSNLEEYFEGDNADAVSKGIGLSVTKGRNMVGYKAQIDLNVRLMYTLVASNAEVAPAAIPAAAQTGLPFFIFGNSDYYSGFSAGLRQNPPAAVWSVVGIYQVGIDNLTGAVFSTAVNQYTKKGDLIMQFSYSTTHYAFMIIDCGQVGYNTLLTSLSSDRFVIGQLRYVVTDTTKVAQFAQNLNIITQSLFGKIASDFISPVAHRDPSNQQTNIIDIRFEKGIDKNVILSSYANYDVGTFTWSMFLTQINRVTA